MGTNKLDRLLFFLVHVSEFAQLLVFIPFSFVMPGPKLGLCPVRSGAFCAQPQNESHVVAKGNAATEDFIVADEPGGDHRNECDGRHDIDGEPAPAATMPAIDVSFGWKGDHREQ